ncbi:metallophosphoesterase [Rhizobium laguerreae]|uniref:metallophosphoesterase n=1 Tax=Rhizobium laguerreae TaxID=1076926 RepID=UPI0021B0CD9F|nr:metallophosphoesterase [Rhizobium laguerreae]
MSETLKAVVFSDLHLKYNGELDYKLDLPVDADVVIVAGDVTSPVSESLKWLHKNIAMVGHDVVFVAGNHEHYGHIYDDSMAGGMTERAKYPNVHFLENEEVVIKGVRFLGASMWTDFNLYERPEEGMKEAVLAMNDYRTIHSRDRSGNVIRFTPERTRSIHEESRRWLRGALAKGHDGPTVVVTHHCPHHLSIHPKYAGDKLNSSFASDFAAEIADFQPKFWIHGHTHSNFDYIFPETRTRVICNPLGYIRNGFAGRREVENPMFDPYLTIEIPLAA